MNPIVTHAEYDRVRRTRALANEIRGLFPDVSRKSLAQRYSVSLPTINRVLRRATYN